MASGEEPARRAPAGKARARRTAKARLGRRAPATWTVTREQLFFASLAETANVSASAKAAGMSEQSAYRRRQTHPAFRAGWLAALRDGYARIELMLLEKALTGQLNPASDRVLLALLAAHRGTVKGIDAADAAADPATRIKARLDQMAARLGNDA